MNEIAKNISDFMMSFYENDKIKVEKTIYNVNEDPAQIDLLKKKKFKQSFIDTIIQVNDFSFIWEDVNGLNENPYNAGFSNILPIKEICSNWKLYNKEYHDEGYEHLKHFYIVDTISPWKEWSVGIYAGKDASDSLYILDNDETYYLGLNLEGYLKMLIATKGMTYWQKALYNYKYPILKLRLLNDDIIQEQLPNLFPEVNMDEVFKLYDSLFIEPKTKALYNQFIGIYTNLYANKLVKVMHPNTNVDYSTDKQLTVLEKVTFMPSFLKGIRQLDNWGLGWKDVNNPNIWGIIYIQSVKDIVASAKKYKKLAKEDDRFHHFHTVDDVIARDHEAEKFEQPETVAGIFSGPYATNALYLKEKEGVLQYLGLDMSGYAQMGLITRGFFNWQKALIEYKKGETNSTALVTMKEHLPRLFPEVNIDEVFALYDSLYIYEQMVPGAE